MFYFIVNPIAGQGDFAKQELKLKAHLMEFGLEGEFAKTISAGDAVHLAHVGLKKGYEKVVCVGGDGTVNEIVNGLAGADVRLGIIPWGRHNTIASALRVPLDWRDAVKVLLSEEERIIDLGLLGQRLFVAVAGLGGRSDSPEAESFNVRLKIDESWVLQSNVTNVSFVNLNWRSAHKVAALPIRANDEQFEVFLSSVNAGSELSYFRAKQIEVSSSDFVPVHLDYEVLRMPVPFQIEMAELKQRFIVL